MSNSRRFSLGAILSVTDGHLVAPIDDVYRIVNFLTGDNISTIGLLAAHDPCRNALLAQHPQLAAIDGSSVNIENWRTWLATQEMAFGESLDIVPMKDWTRRSIADDILDVNRMNPDAGIIALDLTEDDPDAI